MGGIIWLASFPKSGNTWTRAFLTNLLLNQDRPALPNQLDRFARGDLKGQYFEHFSKKPLAEMQVEEFAPLRDKVNKMLASSSPESVFVKTHNALVTSYDHPVISMDVTAGAIYIVRNPLDVTLSFADHFGLDIDAAIDRMADEHSVTGISPKQAPAVLTSWSKHVESWTGRANPQLHIMRYEDMLAKPVKTFGKLCKFLGLNVPHARLMKAIKFSSFKTLQKLEAEKGFTERSDFSQKFFRKGQAEQWRKELTPAQVQRICSLQETQMRRFGYLPREFQQGAD